MEKNFLNYEQSLTLKELGFDDECLAYYAGDKKDFKWRPSMSRSNDNQTDVVTAPLKQQAFKFFREKYRLDGKPKYFLNDWYCFIINDMKGEDNSRRLFTEFPSYEEAELECLKKLIQIVKERK